MFKLKLSAITWMIACTIWKCTGNISIGLTLYAHEGDKVFIPCISVRQEKDLSILWEINDVVQSSDSLQSRNLVRISSGLLVNNIGFGDAGQYTCYSHDSTGLQQLYVVHLGVVPSLDASALDQHEEESITSGNLPIDIGLYFQVTENNVAFLPCIPALGTQDITIWTIDGVIYPSIKLPKGHLHYYGGILVDPVTLGTTGLVYECFTSSNNSIEVLYTIYLSIQPSKPKEALTSVFRQSAITKINLVSQKVNFNKTHKNFGFKIRGTGLISESSEILFITEIIRLNEPGVILWDSISMDFEPIFSIPNYFFENNNTAYGNTFAKNLTSGDNKPIAQLHFLYTANENEINDIHYIMEDLAVCLDLPANKTGLSIIWPTHPNSDEDCSCPIFVQKENSPKFNDCYCFRNNLTTFNVELQNNDHLCFKNLDCSSNDTKVLLTRDTQLTFTTLRRFESQVQILVSDSESFLSPPNLIYYNDSKNLCVESNYTEQSPIKGTSVVVNDITGNIILDRIFPMANFCFDFNLLSQSCAPFHVNMSAFSLCTLSAPSSFQAGTGNGSECVCLNEKVSVILNITHMTSDEIVVTINSSCLEYDIQLVLNISLTATTNCSTCKNASTYFTIICELIEPYNLTISDVSSSTKYIVTAEWVSPNTENHCLLGESQYIETEAVDDYNLSILLIIICSTITFIFVLFIIVFISVFICVLPHRYCGSRYSDEPSLISLSREI